MHRRICRGGRAASFLKSKINLKFCPRENLVRSIYFIWKLLWRKTDLLLHHQKSAEIGEEFVRVSQTNKYLRPFSVRRHILKEKGAPKNGRHIFLSLSPISPWLILSVSFSLDKYKRMVELLYTLDTEYEGHGPVKR